MGFHWRVVHHACVFSWGHPSCFNAVGPSLPHAVGWAPSSVYSFASISTELWLLLLCLRKTIVLPLDHGCLGAFTHHSLPSAVIYLSPSASHHVWHVEVWSVNTKLSWTLCQNYSGCAVGSFAMTCGPVTSFWQFSNAHEVFLQPFITVLMGFLQLFFLLLAKDPSSLDSICSASSAEASFVKVLFLADSLLECSCSPSDFGSLHPDVTRAAPHLQSWLLFIFLPCYLFPRTLTA